MENNFISQKKNLQIKTWDYSHLDLQYYPISINKEYKILVDRKYFIHTLHQECTNLVYKYEKAGKKLPLKDYIERLLEEEYLFRIFAKFPHKEDFLKRMLTKFKVGKKATFLKYILYTALNNQCSLAFIQQLFEKGAVVDNSKEYNSLVIAIRKYSEYKVAKFLIGKGANLHSPDVLGYVPFVYALRNNKKKFLKYLIKKGFKITTTCPKVNFLSSMEKAPQELYIQTKEKIGRYVPNKGHSILCSICPNITIVHYAIFLNVSAEILQFLIENGAPFKVPDPYGYTPLHYTIKYKFFRHAEILIKNGQKLDKNYPDGTSILKTALFSGNPQDTVELLLKNNAKFSKADQISLILDFLLENNVNKDIINLFLKYYPPNQKNFFNNKTPLVCAVEGGNINAIKLLLKYGANPYLSDKQTLCPPFEATDDVEIQEGFKFWNSIVYDFERLMDLEEACDFELQLQNEKKHFSLHKLMIKCRLGFQIDFDKFTEILSPLKYDQVKKIIKWIYTGTVSPRHHESVYSVINLFGVSKELFEKKTGKQGLVHDLNNLYLDQKSKDFTILLSDEGLENIEDEEEKKKLEEKVHSHRLILQARSGLFRELFVNVIDLSINQIHDYTNISFTALNYFMKFLYTDKIPSDIPIEHLYELKGAQDFYKLSKHSNLNVRIKQINRPKIKKEARKTVLSSVTSSISYRRIDYRLKYRRKYLRFQKKMLNSKKKK
ncbi:ankyrin repeat-containing protein [Anaeramoeba flamelloides]|uniref:Ankyrin repeat-containing protein n=1 Tax=Anaeramoeba flamelloides TaxID=1746091 RepID=A0ABQ8ZA91_9EUKA|nr:ankyrin repeat-containing protein [Anaeramoeba flamelloides]